MSPGFQPVELSQSLNPANHEGLGRVARLNPDTSGTTNRCVSLPEGLQNVYAITMWIYPMAEQE